MSVGRFFSRGTLVDFSINFSRGERVVKFVFSHSEVRKQSFFAETFKTQDAKSPLPSLLAPMKPCTIVMGVGRILSRGRVQKWLFPGGGQWQFSGGSKVVKFHFTNSRNEEKNVFLPKRSWENIKFQNPAWPRPPCNPLSDAHAWTLSWL